MTDATMVAQDHLRSFVERIERLEEEKKGIADDIKDVYAEAKGNGFDTKVLRKVVALRKQDANERAAHEAILDLYLEALGMAHPTAELPMEMERVRRADRPKSGIDQAIADRAAEVREKIGLGPAAVEVTIKPAAAKPSKSTKPKTADEARERLPANSPTYD